MAETTAECVVVGAGPAGLAAAAALATTGIEVALAGLSEPDRPTEQDTRTAALFPASIALLRRLDAWNSGLGSGAAGSAALLAVRLVDATGGLLRAPELLFSAKEIGWPGFGFNVPQSELSRSLSQAVQRSPVRVLRGGPVVALAIEGRATAAAAQPGAVLTLADGSRIRTTLVVAADGRTSLCRQAAGIAARQWSYPQTAIATRFEHSRPHHGFSNELHTPAGPCTTVPLPGAASSLVWVERPDEAARLAGLAPDAFVSELETRLGGLLGTLAGLGARRSFPLTGLAAETLAHNRVALVGEAGHVIPPIGAQGLNLGLLDVAVLADCVADARRRRADIGGPETLAAYAATRKTDVDRRMGAVDLVNRMLISGLLPLSLARGAGLHLIAASPALRRRLMLEGLQPSGPLPTLMSGD